MTSESAMRPYGAQKVANKDFNSKKKIRFSGDVVADREFIRTISQPGFVGKKHDQILFLTLNSQSLPPSSSQFTRHNPQQIPLVECIRRPPTAPHFPVLIPITSPPKHRSIQRLQHQQFSGSRAMNWVQRKIYLYNVTFGLFMLDWWERYLFNILVIVLMWFIFYNGSRYVTDFCKSVVDFRIEIATCNSQHVLLANRQNLQPTKLPKSQDKSLSRRSELSSFKINNLSSFSTDLITGSRKSVVVFRVRAMNWVQHRIRVCESLNFGRYSGDRVDVVHLLQWIAICH
ncbi:hypothetical protein NC651_007293 [Populus alba x Populus x berolinensis]|nr:hypothetical protein NC651_007293 [Populus alba x Populus x berolinensis]